MRCYVVVVMKSELKKEFLSLNLGWDGEKDLEVDNQKFFAVYGDDWKWYEGIKEFNDVIGFIEEKSNLFCLSVDNDFQTLEWGNTDIKDIVDIDYDFTLKTPFNEPIKYLVMDLDHFEGSDLSNLTDKEFESFAKMSNGYIFTNESDFMSAFNSQIISTDTHQLRIVT